MAKQGRSILGMIVKNFIQSLKPRQIRGTYIGNDHFGNKYYEIPANPKMGKRIPNRWFVPKEKDNFEQELPAEWEAWLRRRRSDPPSQEELERNLAIMDMKKINAAKLEEEERKLRPTDVAKLEKVQKGASSFPRYEEFETTPGKPETK